MRRVVLVFRQPQQHWKIKKKQQIVHVNETLKSPVNTFAAEWRWWRDGNSLSAK